jgi:hypothetical protein
MVELGHAEQRHRQPGGQQHLLGGELGAVVTVRDPVDPDDRHVDEVPQPAAVHRLGQPPGPRDVDLPRVAAGVAGRVDDDLRARQRLGQVPSGGQITTHPTGAGAAARHLPHGVALLLERCRELLSEPSGPPGHEYVHGRSLAPAPGPRTRDPRMAARPSAGRSRHLSHIRDNVPP